MSDDIFLSYASADRERARALAAALEGFGWSVFWDREIPAGADWRDHIGKALSEARCLVVAWSAASIASHWVREEADEGAKKGILVPVLLEPVLPPMGLRSFQALDLSNWTAEDRGAELQQLAKDIERLLGSPPIVPEPVDVRTSLSGVVTLGLITINYALLMYTIRVGWHFFEPLNEYLASSAAWPQFLVPLGVFAPQSRSALRPLFKVFRGPRTRLRTAATIGSLALSVALVAIASSMTPRLELEAITEGIDAGEAGEPKFQDVAGGSIAADQLCRGEQAPPSGCHPPLPQDGHLRLKIRLGQNRTNPYRLRLEGGPPEVGFARVRVQGSLAAAAETGGAMSAGRLLEITGKRQATPPLRGTVEVRLLCRQLRTGLSAEPTLRATLGAGEEGHDDGRRISKCWSLANGRVGAPCSLAESGGLR